MLEIFKLKLSETVSRGTVEKLLPFVDKEKRTRVLRYYRWDDTLRSLFADLLARNALITRTGLRNEEINFEKNPYGKPELKTVPDFHFNVSHSGQWVVCAVDVKPVGIDVEEISPVDLDISKNYFSSEEHNDLLEKNDKLSYFFTLWTLKESYIKIIGKGLSHPLNAFSIRFMDNEINIAAEGQKLDDTFFAQYHIDEKYKMAVCARRKEFPEDIVEKSPRDVVDFFLGS